MTTKLTSITLNTLHLEDMLNFYSLLGLEFTKNTIRKGGHAYRAQVGDCELSLCSIQSYENKNTPALQLSFEVKNLHEKVTQMKSSTKAICILDPSEMPDGKKAIVLDPDGHSVELKEI